MTARYACRPPAATMPAAPLGALEVLPRNAWPPTRTHAIDLFVADVNVSRVSDVVFVVNGARTNFEAFSAQGFEVQAAPSVGDVESCDFQSRMRSFIGYLATRSETASRPAPDGTPVPFNTVMLPPNRTVCLRLRLSPRGQNGIFRFTHFAYTASGAPVRRLVVERIAGPTPAGRRRSLTAADYRATHDIALDGTWAQSPDAPLVLTALDALGTRALAAVSNRGIRFTRATGRPPPVSGQHPAAWYMHSTRTVTIFAGSQPSDACHGPSGLSGFEWTVLHELGHAVAAFDAPLFNQFVASGQHQHPFTHYGRTATAGIAGERFAEAFALYAADPDLLLRLRPTVHAFMHSRFS
jgi:hypothetical protein